MTWPAQKNNKQLLQVVYIFHSHIFAREHTANFRHPTKEVNTKSL